MFRAYFTVAELVYLARAVIKSGLVNAVPPDTVMFVWCGDSPQSIELRSANED